MKKSLPPFDVLKPIPDAEIPQKDKEKYQEEFEHFQQELDKKKEEFQKEHPDVQGQPGKLFLCGGFLRGWCVFDGVWVCVFCVVSRAETAFRAMWSCCPVLRLVLPRCC